MKRLMALAIFVALAGRAMSASSGEALALEQRSGRQEARMLTGHVLSVQSEPVQKAIVYLKNLKTLAIKTYITETDGSYRFPALSPNVDYEVYAEQEGARTDTKTISAFDSRKQINITLKLHSK